VAYASGNIPAKPRKGPIAIVSQSGGCSFTLLNRAWRNGIGVGHVAVAGNEIDVTIPDFIEYYLEQTDVASIACYMEAVRDPTGLRRVGELAARTGKSVFVMRSGSSELGQRAAAAHTGALATSDAVCDVALEQWGLIRARTFDELISAAAISARYGPVGEQRFGVYAQGGGLAVVASDLFDNAGLALAELAPSTAERLKARLPDTTPGNPFDSGGQFLSQGPEVLADALNDFTADPDVTAGVYMLMPVAGTRLAIYTDAVVTAVRSSAKPTIVLQYGAGAITRESTERIVDCGVPLLDPPEAGIRALRLWSGSASRAPTDCQSPRLSDPAAAAATRIMVDEWRGAGRFTVSEHDAGRLLAGYGIDHVRQRLVTSETELADVVSELTAPYVVKIASDDVVHRSEVGGVRLGLTDHESVLQAYRKVLANVKAAYPEAVVQGVTVCETAPAGLELIIGVTRDDTFGPVVMLGVGGVHAEMWQDTTLRLPPFAASDVEAMIDRLRSAPLLRGTRGTPAIDLNALIDLVVRVGELAIDFGDTLAAFEMNPVIASPTQGSLKAADALIELVAAT
jgi:acyl-CoA synthetase (NDP forming)